MRISDWSSDVCSSDLATLRGEAIVRVANMFGVTAGAMKGVTRHAPVVAARKYFMREMHDAGLSSGTIDRKSVVSGKSVSVRVDLGGRRIIKKKKITHQRESHD